MTLLLWSALALMGAAALGWLGWRARAARPSRGLLAALLAIPAVAVATYLFVGQPQALTRATVAVAGDTGHAGALDQMATRLAARLEREPDDVEGWRLLARTREYLGDMERARAADARADALESGDDGLAALRVRAEQAPQELMGWVELGRAAQRARRYAEAADAYARATTLRPDQATLWADRADAAASATDGGLAPVAGFIDTALRLDPDHPKALWLAGTLALEQQDRPRALAIWKHLADVLPPEDPLSGIIAANIAELEPERSGGAGSWD